LLDAVTTIDLSNSGHLLYLEVQVIDVDPNFRMVSIHDANMTIIYPLQNFLLLRTGFAFRFCQAVPRYSE
jgi:hypothetical protein